MKRENHKVEGNHHRAPAKKKARSSGNKRRKWIKKEIKDKEMRKAEKYHKKKAAETEPEPKPKTKTQKKQGSRN